MTKLTRVTRLWSAAEAKAKLSEIIAKALSEGPQYVTRHGKPTVVVVSAEQWSKLERRRSSVEVLTDPTYGVLDEGEAETLFARDRSPERPAPEL
ncbi:MAG: type II toxin-antitoxin system Phd/YefM family antitoxin [Proteobacteria bacterium]|nr:type II toxin-antitoxin system Phd/YefM family antitoxin [Pseudomonadota bacterium]